MAASGAALLLAAAPAMAERTAFLGLELLAAETDAAASLARRVEKTLRGLPEVTLADGTAVRALMDGEAALRDCGEPRCLAEIAKRLDVQSVLAGVAGAVGGYSSLVLRRTDGAGQLVASVSGSGDADDATLRRLICDVMLRGPDCLPLAASPATAAVVDGPAPNRLPTRRRVALGLGVGALLSVATGLGFGLAANGIADDMEQQRTGCAGTGDAYAACVEDRFGDGRRRALTANILFGVGGAAAAAAAVLWWWSPGGHEVSVAIGPANGMSVHARF